MRFYRVGNGGRKGGPFEASGEVFFREEFVEKERKARRKEQQRLAHQRRKLRKQQDEERGKT